MVNKSTQTATYNRWNQKPNKYVKNQPANQPYGGLTYGYDTPNNSVNKQAYYSHPQPYGGPTYGYDTPNNGVNQQAYSSHPQPYGELTYGYDTHNNSVNKQANVQHQQPYRVKAQGQKPPSQGARPRQGPHHKANIQGPRSTGNHNKQQNSTPSNSQGRQQTTTNIQTPGATQQQTAAPNQNNSWKNRFTPLLSNPEPDDSQSPALIQQPTHQKRNTAQPKHKTTKLPVSEPQIKAISRGYYLPGKLATKGVKFLIDTGCTNTVLSTSLYNSLSEHIRGDLRAESGSATAANGHAIPTHGWIRLRGRLRSQVLETDFLVADILEDAILGLDFLEKEGATLSFRTAELTYKNKKLVCMDHNGKPLMARI